MMIIGIFNARIYRAHPGEFASATDLAEHGEANNHDENHDENAWHDESPFYEPAGVDGVG
jgi:hypothetical protein